MLKTLKTDVYDLGNVCVTAVFVERFLEHPSLVLKPYLTDGKVLILCDDFFSERVKKQIQSTADDKYHWLFIEAGKKNKTFATALRIFNYMDRSSFARDCTIVGIGGGVIGDLAGFIASLWYRGTRLIQVPTTLLAAVDSCLGGKTALNFRTTVNAIGTYCHPTHIIIDLEILKLLPKREIYSGYAEIIKYALLGSIDIQSELDESGPDQLSNLMTLVSLSLKEKRKYVYNDVQESSNRLFLNFGHTVGHAIEACTIRNGEETLRHGEGVALGLVSAMKISCILGSTSETKLKNLKLLLHKYNLPTTISAGDYRYSKSQFARKIVDLCFKDKKRTNSHLRLVLIGSEGPFIYPTADTALLEAGINEVLR